MKHIRRLSASHILNRPYPALTVLADLPMMSHCVEKDNVQCLVGKNISLPVPPANLIAHVVRISVCSSYRIDEMHFTLELFLTMIASWQIYPCIAIYSIARGEAQGQVVRAANGEARGALDQQEKRPKLPED